MPDESQPPRDPSSPRNPRTHPEVACEQCGVIVAQRRKGQRFCSSACYQQWWTIHRQRDYAAKGTQRLVELTSSGSPEGKRISEKIAKSNRLNPRRQARSRQSGSPSVGTEIAIADSESFDATAWLAAGQRWEDWTQRRLRKDREQMLILAGHGVRLQVRHGSLVIHEGITHDPQPDINRILARGVHGIGRIVLLAQSGMLSLDALSWCRQQDIMLSIVDRNGSLVSCITSDERRDAKLRRAQYLAHDNVTALGIACWIILRKLRGQLATIQHVPYLPGAAQAAITITETITTVERQPAWLNTVDAIRTAEGWAAASYFAAWRGLPLNWRTSDRKRLPQHWQIIRERSSPLSQNARRAVDPVNAMLNYAYAVLEGQCRHALAIHGFDPLAGFLHADRDGRDSLVYDLMEPFRPVIDTALLSFLDRTTFRYGDFIQGTDGRCRLHPQLGRAVVAACRIPQSTIDGTARDLRDRLTRTP